MNARSLKGYLTGPKFPALLALLILAALVLSACGDSTSTASTAATTARATTAAGSATTAAGTATTAAAATTAAINTAPPAAATTAAAAATTAATAAKKGGVVRIGISQEPDTLNLPFSAESVAGLVGGLVLEPLIDVSPEGQYIPKLAAEVPTTANGGLSADGKTITYKLKKGVKWSDGTPFTSKDVAYTVKVYQDAANGLPSSGYRQIASVETPDETTAIIKLKELYAPFAYTLFGYVLPEHVFKGQTAIEKNEFGRKPIGTGPFQLKSWTTQENIILERNPNYREAGKPYIDGIIFRIIKSREAAIQGFIANEVDVLWDLTEEQIPQFEKMADAMLDVAPSVSTERLILNFSNPTGDKAGDPESKHPVLGDLKVRQAIELGINKKLLVDSLLYGKTTPGTAVIPQGWAKSNAQPSEFSAEKAKALLEEAGWKPGSDGIREKDGVRMKLEFGTTSGNKLREKTQQLIQEQLKTIGIQLEIKNVPSDQLFASWDKNGARKRGKYDILMWTTEPGIDPASHIRNYFHSSNIPTDANKGGGANYSRWKNAEVDKAIDEAEASTDPAKRAAAYQVVNDKLRADVPQILLYNRLNIDAFKKTIVGHKPNIWSQTWLAWNAEEWTVNK